MSTQRERALNGFDALSGRAIDDLGEGIEEELRRLLVESRDSPPNGSCDGSISHELWGVLEAFLRARHGLRIALLRARVVIVAEGR